MNNPVNIGNPNIQPETIAMNELALAWQPTTTLQAGLTVFRYRMEDIIRQVPNADPVTGTTAQNAGAQDGRGLELEATWDVARHLRLSGNLSLQRSTDQASDKDAGLAPRRRFYARADWRPAPLWQVGAMANHVAGRQREPGDSRPLVDDYTLVDLTVARQDAGGKWELRAGVANLFDTDAREPTFAPGNVRYDLPLAGRSFTLQLSYRP